MQALRIYVAGSFKHKHGVRLLGRELRALGCRMLDWTEKSRAPVGPDPGRAPDLDGYGQGRPARCMPFAAMPA